MNEPNAGSLPKLGWSKPANLPKTEPGGWVLGKIRMLYLDPSYGCILTLHEPYLAASIPSTYPKHFLIPHSACFDELYSLARMCREQERPILLRTSDGFGYWYNNVNEHVSRTVTEYAVVAYVQVFDPHDHSGVGVDNDPYTYESVFGPL